jgi:argininosuccinate lyase
VGGLVRAALERGKGLSELTAEEVREHAPALDGGFHELLDERAALESKISEGGTSLARVREQLAHARHVLDEVRA